MNNLTFYTVCASCTTEFLEQFHIEKMSWVLALLFCNFTSSFLQLYFKANALPSCKINLIQVFFDSLFSCFRNSRYEMWRTE